MGVVVDVGGWIFVRYGAWKRLRRLSLWLCYDYSSDGDVHARGGQLAAELYWLLDIGCGGEAELGNYELNWDFAAWFFLWRGWGQL